MNLVCYLPWGHELSSELLLRFRPLSEDSKVEIVRGLEDLAQRLALPRVEGMVLLAMPATRRELSDMQEMPALLRGIPMILGLPDDDPRTLAQAHRLMPRYAIPVKGAEDFEAMTSVMARIVDKYSRREESEDRSLEPSTAGPKR